MVDLLAGLRQIGEGGVFLRIRQIERPAAGGDLADKAAAGIQRHLVHGIQVEPPGGVELQHTVGAQHIDRAHLRNHVGGDLCNDLVQALLGAERFCHDLTQAAHKHTWPRKRLSARHNPLLENHVFVSPYLVKNISGRRRPASQRAGLYQPDYTKAPGSGCIQIVYGMQGPHRKFGIGGIDQD